MPVYISAVEKRANYLVEFYYSFRVFLLKAVNNRFIIHLSDFLENHPARLDGDLELHGGVDLGDVPIEDCFKLPGIG